VSRRTTALQQTAAAMLVPCNIMALSAVAAAELGRSAKEGDGMTAVQGVVADLKDHCGEWGDNP
jgi:hypothetical protein